MAAGIDHGIVKELLCNSGYSVLEFNTLRIIVKGASRIKADLATDMSG